MTAYMSMETLRFLLHDVHRMEDLFALDRYKDYDTDTVDILLNTAKDWADKEFYPYFREMDEQPCTFKDGRVTSHPQLKNIFKQAGENGWIGPYMEYEYGGMQLPFTLSNSLNHILESANNHIPGYLGLTAGSAHLITSFGSDALKALFVEKMMKGQWAGTMCLTEPQAGSSLSDITTTAYRRDDGTFSVKGQKIFISGGDHEAAENFVHLTLVRIEGAPKGTKGISLMVIPRMRVSGDDLVFNDVVTAGDFQKLGQRGYSTVHLSFGENNDCTGYLVGEENKGLKYMFQMMNGARLDVGMTAASVATAAYYASLQYANERPQGRRLESNGRKNPNKEQTLIINHADVRRMLLLQKSIVEGSLSLIIEASKCQDLAFSANKEEAEANHLLLELLTPIAKTYPSEKGKISVDNGLQILGGYGFCSDFVLQQYYRDVRIMSLYEGTTGIQSIDLLGRKMMMQNGKAVHLLWERLKEVIDAAKKLEELRPYAGQLEGAISLIQKVLEQKLPLAMAGDYEEFLADATVFMELMGNIVVAYQWLKMALKAKQAIDNGDMEFQTSFYENKISTMKFYFKYELPKAQAAFQTLMNSDDLTIVKEENSEIFN